MSSAWVTRCKAAESSAIRSNAQHGGSPVPGADVEMGPPAGVVGQLDFELADNRAVDPNRHTGFLRAVFTGKCK